MIKEIVTDYDQLKLKSKTCFFTDLDVLRNKMIIENMLDTAEYNRENCIGLAANQIGELRRIILVEIKGELTVMVNPEYTPVKSAGIKRYKEGCLSVPERMHVNRIIQRRYKKIHVTYNLVTGAIQKISLTGIEAVTAQHEIDHLNGIVI